MPEYDYYCPNCGTFFTVKRAMDEVKPTEPCPACAEAATRRFGTPHLARFVPADANDPEQWRGVE